MTEKTKLSSILLALLLALSILLTGCNFALPGGDNQNNDGQSNSGGNTDNSGDNTDGNTDGSVGSAVPENVVINGEKIPAYTGDEWYVVNGGTPFFTEHEITNKGFYEYTELDVLGRCGAAWGSIGLDTMPTDDRESISHIYPSGWKYNGVSNNHEYPKETGVNGTIYNRAHLLANQLVSEDVDKRNLITGTSAMNQLHMVKFENMVADYVHETEGHVMYRVTPIFEGNNLVCSGVLMEGLSVDDNGESVMFCVFVYNVQPGIYINYLTGENRLASEDGGEEPPAAPELPYDIITSPLSDTPYLLLGNYNVGERFFSGTINSGLETTGNRDSATEVYFEAEGSLGAYYIYYYSTSGEKLYITMTGNETTSLAASKTKDSFWVFNHATGVLVTSREETHTTLGKRSLSLDPSRPDIRAYYHGQVENGTYEPLLVVLYKTAEAE